MSKPAILTLRNDTVSDRYVTTEDGSIPYFPSFQAAYAIMEGLASDNPVRKATACEIYSMQAARACHGSALVPWCSDMVLVDPLVLTSRVDGRHQQQQQRAQHAGAGGSPTPAR